MAARQSRSARRIEYVVGEPTSLLNSPLGADLRKLEEKIRTGDRAGIEARWQFGRRLVRYRQEQKKLPKGLINEIVAQHGVSASEIRHRMKCAEKYPDIESFSMIIENERTWWNIYQHALYEKRQAKAKTDDPKIFDATRVEIRRLRKNLTATRHHLTPAFRNELSELLALLTDILAEADRKAAK